MDKENLTDAHLCTITKTQPHDVLIERVGLPERGPRTPSWADVKPQIFATGVALSCAIQAGINMAFPGVLIPQIANDPNFKSFTKTQASWIAGLSVITVPLGSILLGPMTDLIGRKGTCMAANVPFIASWAFTYFTTNSMWTLYLGRVLLGFGAGMCSAAIVYTSEVAHSVYRPMLLSLNSVNVALGVLLTTVLGVNLDWHTLAIIFGTMSLVGLILTSFIPESPFWSANFSDATHEEIRALTRRLNRPDWLFDEAWAEVQKGVAPKKQDETPKVKTTCQKLMNTVRDFAQPASYKPMLVLIISFLLQQTSGSYIIIFYSVNIFRSICGDLSKGVDEYSATVAFGILRFVLSIVALVLAKCMGRRPLMLISSIGMGLTSLGVGVSLQLNRVETIHFTGNATDLSQPVSYVVDPLWILCMLLMYVCSGTVGVTVIPWILCGEILPVKIRSVGSGIIIAYAFLLLFVVVKTFPGLLDYTSLPTIFMFYSAMSFVSAVYVHFCFPETFKKNFTEIAKVFEGKSILVNK